MMRVMFDSNIWDAVLENGDANRIGLLIGGDTIRLITTHIQEDQLKRISDKKKQTALLEIYRRLTNQTVNTSAALWDVSTWDQSNLSGDDEEKSLSAIQRNRVTMSDDEVIGLTAKDQCDIFVTEDGKFAARLAAASPNLRVLNYSDFRLLYLA